jgi:hypothetical protein
MDEWREASGAEMRRVPFIRDTEMDDASTLLTKALNLQARHPKKNFKKTTTSAGGYTRCVHKY